MSHPSFTLANSDEDDAMNPQTERMDPSRRRQMRRAIPGSTWQQKLGLDLTVSKLNVSAFFLHSAASITFLVFLNAIQPFLITQLGFKERQGSLSGTLVFSDEALSLVMTLIWGSAADLVGTRFVASLSFALIGLGLLSYSFVAQAWPDLLFARLIFALGGSGATTMLSAILASYSDPVISEQKPPSSGQVEGGPTESTSLLAGISDSPAPSRDDPIPSEESPTTSKSGRLAGLAGLFTGFGALFAVFSLLRLPVLFSKLHNGSPNLRDLRHSFWLVAALSILVSILLFLGLQPQKKPEARAESRDRRSTSNYGSTSASQDPREARRQRLRSRLPTSRLARLKSLTSTLIKGTLSGFALASNDAELILAYLGGSLARAVTIGTSLFIPLIISRFFFHSGKCPILPPDDSSPEELKKICREAYTLASAIGGVIQLIALLLAPLIGFLSDAISPVITLGSTSLIGAVSFCILGVNLSGEGNGDPRSPLAWISAIGVGASQIGAIVSSLVLLQRARARAGDKSGGIAGAYSSTGGLSVLITSKLGGLLFDMWSPSPFLLIAGLSFIVVAASIIVNCRSRASR